jgi:hypothetical protein
VCILFTTTVLRGASPCPKSNMQRRVGGRGVDVPSQQSRSNSAASNLSCLWKNLKSSTEKWAWRIDVVGAWRIVELFLILPRTAGCVRCRGRLKRLSSDSSEGVASRGGRGRRCARP